MEAGGREFSLHGRVVKGVGHLGHNEAMEAGGLEFDEFLVQPGNRYGFLIWMCLSFPILNLFGMLSPWGSGNYRPSAPFLYEVAGDVKNCHFGDYYLFIFRRWAWFTWIGSSWPLFNNSSYCCFVAPSVSLAHSKASVNPVWLVATLLQRDHVVNINYTDVVQNIFEKISWLISYLFVHKQLSGSRYHNNIHAQKTGFTEGSVDNWTQCSS